MWQSFRAIGRVTSENAWRKKEENICGKTSPSGTVVPGGLTSPARLAQLLQPSLAFCLSLQPMTAHWTVASYNKMLTRAATVVQVLSFIACFILLVIASSLRSACRS